MRRVLSFAGAVALALLVGAASAEAQTRNFTAQLSGANETPGIITGAGGTATITLNTATQAVTYRIDVYNMPSGTTASHFHVGTPVNLQAVLEPQHGNRFVAIEPESGEYFLGDTFDEAVKSARAKHPSRLSHTIRIGHRAAFHIGGVLR